MVNGPVAERIDIVMNGRLGTAMIGFSTQLEDAELAAIISYERNAWGLHSDDTVTASDIAAASAGSDFIQAFARDRQGLGDEDILQLDRVYIVDPLENLVMAYESGFDAKGLLKDLQRLLRRSSIG